MWLYTADGGNNDAGYFIASLRLAILIPSVRMSYDLVNTLPTTPTADKSTLRLCAKVI